MLTGNGSTSIRKKDLAEQKSIATGFRKSVFAHKASAGQTGFNLTALTTPTELTAQGFSQPPTAELTNAQLLFYRNNLKLISSARGVLVDYLSYTVASSTQINFIGFTALEGEIFYGIIDYNAQTGVKVVDASPIIATGTLLAGQTDFNVGAAFKVGQYGSQNVGAVLVYVDRVLQQRNTSNSSVTQDRDYYEVDSGSGLGSIIRFNNADAVNDREITVVSNGILSERPDGSMMAVIESLSGSLDNVVSVVAALSGLSTSTVKGAAPSNVDLKNFGDRVLTMESNRARIDQSNVWTAPQPLVGRIDGGSPGSSELGYTISASVQVGSALSLTSATALTIAFIDVPAGNWKIGGIGAFRTNTTTSITSLTSAISKTNNAIPATTANAFPVSDELRMAMSTAAQVPGANADNMVILPSYRISLTTTTRFYLVLQGVFTVSTLVGYGSITAERVP